MAKKNITDSEQEKEIKCSFCNHSSDDVTKLIEGPNSIYICKECIELCSELLEFDEEGEEEGKQELNIDSLPKPKELKEILDQSVIGQDDAKKRLSVAVYNHYKRILKQKEEGKDIEVQKSNIFLLGATGTGKTLLAQTLAKVLDVPFAIADATTLTQAGYVGDDPENILLRLIKDADYDIEKAEKGIIYIDEIDKIAKKGDNPSITRDVSGEGVQQALLKILEGTIASVPPQGGRKHPMQENISINTQNILFICGGSFDGLEKIVSKRLGGSEIGLVKSNKEYVMDEKDIFKHVKAVDLIKFGLIPEFVGRIPVISKLQKLDVKDMVKILTEPKNAIIKQYQYLMGLDNIKLTFEQDALEFIADEVIKNNTGARGLRSLLEDIMQDAMYELPGSEEMSYNVTKEMIKDKVDLFK